MSAGVTVSLSVDLAFGAFAGHLSANFTPTKGYFEHVFNQRSPIIETRFKVTFWSSARYLPNLGLTKLSNKSSARYLPNLGVAIFSHKSSARYLPNLGLTNCRNQSSAHYLPNLGLTIFSTSRLPAICRIWA